MDVLAKCTRCEGDFLYWSITRPPPRSTRCKCGGELLIARGNDPKDIADLLEAVYRGASPRRKRQGALKLASKIENGGIAANKFLNYSDDQQKQQRKDARAGHILSGAVVMGGCALYVRSVRPGFATLESQVNELALRVLADFDKQFSWVPGPSEPAAVLRPKETRPNKTDSREKSQKTVRTETSDAPKRGRREIPKAKRGR